MAIKNETGKYKCSYCDKLYDDPTQADTCREGHNLIYVPLTRDDINSLIAFLYTKNEKHLKETAVKQLLKFRSLRVNG